MIDFSSLQVALLVGGLIAAVLLTLLLTTVAVVKKLLYVCGPHEILIFSGREHRSGDGRKVGFRIVNGGRSLRVPIVEKVDRMDMRLISVPMRVDGAYSQGGIPLTVDAIANVKVSSDRNVVVNAIERFLGCERSEIARVAKETLEGHLRGVVANMTPEAVNEDRLAFANRLEDEAGRDLTKLGLQLDTLKIQHVSDDRNYLDSIGRKRIAEIKRDAEVAESDAVRAAEEAEAEQVALGKVAEQRARAAVLQKQNAVRHAVAQLEAATATEEERTTAAADEARARAEQQLQAVRGELETIRLEAEVAIPARIRRQVSELRAAGEAARIEANGEAMASALAEVSEAWHETGGKALEMVVLQNLEEIFESVAGAARGLRVEDAALIDGGDGEALARYAAAYPATIGALLGEVKRTLGVDIAGILTNSAPHEATRSAETASEHPTPQAA